MGARVGVGRGALARDRERVQVRGSSRVQDGGRERARERERPSVPTSSVASARSRSALSPSLGSMYEIATRCYSPIWAPTPSQLPPPSRRRRCRVPLSSHSSGVRVCTPPVRPRRAMHTSHSPVLQALPTLTHNSRASPFRALDPPCPSPPSSSSRGASAGRVPQPRGRCLPQRQGRRPGALPVSSRAGPGSASATAHRPALDRARAQRQSRTQWITCTATSSSLTHLSLSCCIGSLAVDRCAPARYCLPLDPCPRLGATSPPPRRQLRGAARTQAPVALARALSHPLLLRSSALLLRAWKDTPSD